MNYTRGKNPNSRNGFKKGRIVSKEERTQMSKRNKKLGIKPPSRLGSKQTEEFKKSKSKFMKGNNFAKGNVPSQKGFTKNEFPNLSHAGVKKGSIPWNKGLGKNKPKINPYTREFNKELKELIKKRDKSCIICKRKDNLHVHHVNYNKNDCRPENLITLCKYCHPRTNTNRKEWEMFFKMDDKNEYKLSLAEMCDRLSIINLKSIILGCNNEEKKEAYEKEAQIFMKDIHSRLAFTFDKINNFGNLIRAIQLQQIMNRLIWENETLARQGDRNQDKLLPFTHSVNSVRMKAGNIICEQTGEKKDLNLDRSVDKINKERGYDFSKIFD